MKTTLRALFVSLLAAAPCSAGLIHHYPFSVDASDAIGGANGVLLNGATVAGGVLRLDGINDYVQFGQKIVPTSGSYSVAFFAREDVRKVDYVEFISQGFSLGPGFYIGHHQSLDMRVSDTWQLTGVPFPTDGGLHHYALTVDAAANVSRLYIDGIVRASLGVAIATTAGGGSTRLGRQFDPFGEYFGGVMDDLRLYDHALSANEVARLAAVPEPSGIVLLGAVGLSILIGRARRRSRLAQASEQIGHRVLEHESIV